MTTSSKLDKVEGSTLGAAPADALDAVREWAMKAHAGDEPLRAWLRCAMEAYRAIAVVNEDDLEAAIALANLATSEAITLLLREHHGGWCAGRMRVGEVEMQVELRNVPSTLPPPLRVRLAEDVPMDAFDGRRYGRAGFGVALAALSSLDADSPTVRLRPHSGAFRNLTAWIEPDAHSEEAPPRLVFADPEPFDVATIGFRRLPLARDTSAAYAWAMEESRLERRGLWGLVGGNQIGRRAGLYLLEDFDSQKCPLVMIHGLGSNPLIWSRVANAVWGEHDLRARFQVWQVVYRTDVPLLAARLHVQDYLDEAWSLLDPQGSAKASSRSVLLGHSLGGVVARLLCAHSGETLWNAAFLVPLKDLDARREDLEIVDRIFHFVPYAGISRAIFLATPHRGSPSASTMLGRLTGDVVGRRTSEVHALRRIAQRNPRAIHPELLPVFLEGRINSITTLQSGQPIRRAAETLMPPAGFPYHTIAGVLPRHCVASDGVVPLGSAILPGAASSLVVRSGHRVHERPAAVAEIVRILREHAAESPLES
ncbi:esterase/lipase family protein [Lysobacter arvi]|uniref:Alpha/beta fold hydrolase n=1 Tax=Lysobacter arvi TaxID=3038776 RepID=A0ABU1CA64_9GAMM|nr:alpha/beta fold hydrolase [Lysobacter arvi]MDR0182010.1 alpha/beta fold hydrolase [Lysobacter arvi]